MGLLERLDAEIKRFDAHVKWSLTDEEGYDFEAADLRQLFEDVRVELVKRENR